MPCFRTKATVKSPLFYQFFYYFLAYGLQNVRFSVPKPQSTFQNTSNPVISFVFFSEINRPQPPRSLHPSFPSATSSPSHQQQPTSPGTPPPAPRDPAKNPPLFTASSSSSSSSGHPHHVIGSSRAPVSRSQSHAEESIHETAAASPLKTVKEGGWKPGR